MKESCTVVIRTRKDATSHALQLVFKENGKHIPVSDLKTCELPEYEDSIVYFENHAKLDWFLYNAFFSLGLRFYVVQIVLNTPPEEVINQYKLDYMSYIWYNLSISIEKDRINEFMGIAIRSNCLESRMNIMENNQNYLVNCGFQSISQMNHCIYSAYSRFSMRFSVISITAIS